MNKLIYEHALARAIVDTINQPLLVLSEDLRVKAANRAFFAAFQTTAEETDGKLLYALGNGQWDIPALRQLLTRVAPDHTVVEGYEVELDLPKVGHRVMLLNARTVVFEHSAQTAILLVIEDITARHMVQKDRDQLLRDKDLLLAEMQHRVANSLQIIASILLMKARTVTSEETRGHLQDAHKRVLSVAAVQQHLHATVGNEAIELRPYLTQLSASLAGSMIGEGSTISIQAQIDEGRVSSSEAVSLGLIVTELVINALKHAFPEEVPGCKIVVAYKKNGDDWQLSVSDNGKGKAADAWPQAKIGLGTSIIASLAKQLSAHVGTVSNAAGTSVAITHANFKALPEVA